MMPTGDPHIAADVLRAKRLYDEIKKHAEVCVGGRGKNEVVVAMEYPDADEYVTANEGEEQVGDDDAGVPWFIHHVEETNDEDEVEGEAEPADDPSQDVIQHDHDNNEVVSLLLCELDVPYCHACFVFWQCHIIILCWIGGSTEKCHGAAVVKYYR